MASIRLARPDERAALEALQWRASLAMPDYRDQLLANRDAVELPAEQITASRVLVAEEGCDLAGFAVWLDSSADEVAELDGLFVVPSRWRQGIGRALVDAAAEAAVLAGRRYLTVIANPGAARFYERCGFVAEGEADTRFGPAPVMTRRLG